MLIFFTEDICFDALDTESRKRDLCAETVAVLCNWILQNFKVNFQHFTQLDSKKEEEKVFIYYRYQGPFTYYVSMFFTDNGWVIHYVSMIYVLIKISKCCHFLNPPSSMLTYVIYEWSLDKTFEMGNLFCNIRDLAYVLLWLLL